MAYDGKILRLALQEFEKDRAQREASEESRRERIFQRQPRQIVIGTLADVPRPPGKQALRHGVAEPFMHQSDDAVHVEIRLAVRLHCQKLRLKPIIPTGCPHQIDGPALPGAVASALHINP